MNKILTIIVVLAIAIFVVGSVVGWTAKTFYKAESLEDVVKNASAEQIKVADMMKLNAVSSIRIFGKVTSILGRTVTMAYNKETMQIAINNDAVVFSIDYNQPKPTQKKSEFKNIKVGDSLNVGLKVTDKYQIQGTSVIIYPAK